jgi:hypothetical protein
MSRGTGSGLLGFGIVLMVVGALMRYAVTADPNGFDVVTAGAILMIVGVVSTVIGLLLLFFGGRTSVTEREQMTQTPHGAERITEREGWSNP